MEEYIVSARKYRPTSFDAVVGQNALTTTLKNAIASGNLAHAYLFCGPGESVKPLVPEFLQKQSIVCIRFPIMKLATSVNHAWPSTNNGL